MKGRKTYLWSFAGYCVLMIWLLFGRERYSAATGYWNVVSNNFNPVPLETTFRFIRILIEDLPLRVKRHAFVNLVGNVVLFVPLGFYPAVLWKRFRPFWRCLLWGGLIIVCVEMIQLFTLLGTCDFDDLLLNVIGIGLGYGLCRATEKG